MVCEFFDDALIQYLCIAAASLMAINIYKYGWSNGWIEGGSILFAIYAVMVVTVANNWVKEKQF